MERDSEKNPETPPDKAGSRSALWRKVRLFLYLTSQSPLPLRQRAEGSVTAGFIGSILTPAIAYLVFSKTEHTPRDNPWLFIFGALLFGGAWIFSLAIVRWGYKTLNELDSE